MSFCFETTVELEAEAPSPRRKASPRRAETVAERLETTRGLDDTTNEIAHDFNNYLQVIASSLELVRRLAANGRTDEIERQAERSLGLIDRASALIRQMHENSRPQANAADCVDVNRVLSSMQETLAATVGPAIEVRFDLAPGLSPILCASQQLTSALVNLAVNARHAMPLGGLLLIETGMACLTEERAPLRPGSYIGIAVSDTGTGMSADVLARACDAYFTTKPRGLGTGLGLASVRNFAARFGGHMDISSAPGAGASITLFLPCV